MCQVLKSKFHETHVSFIYDIFVPFSLRMGTAPAVDFIRFGSFNADVDMVDLFVIKQLEEDVIPR